jgi:predicted house-cleaning noncanonical NTP pyrophosphatase (MazG superfamily)
MGIPYNKLVRDNIPDQLRAKDIAFEERVASDTEYKQELIKKVGEETAEFLADKSVEELADLQEVINTLKQLPEYVNLEEVRLAKLADKGGFEKRIILKGEK